MKTFAIATAAAVLIALSAAGVADAQRGGGGGGRGGGGKASAAPSRPLPPSPEYTTGIVGSYAPATRTLKFNTGGEYRISPSAGAVTIHPGDKVQLRWLMRGDMRVADDAKVTMAAPEPEKTPEKAPEKTSTDAPAPAAADAPASSN